MNSTCRVAAAVRAALTVTSFAMIVLALPSIAAAQDAAADAADETLQEVVILGRGETRQLLGETQWQWLEAQLAEPVDLRILASSLQVVADFPGWEAWINYAEDHQRLLQAIGRNRANGLFCINGDTHYAELSKLETNAPYPLWDLTSSGLTEVWPVSPPNSRRVGAILREQNFGWIEINWSAAPAPQVTLQARDVRGEVRLEQRLSAAELAV